MVFVYLLLIIVGLMIFYYLIHILTNADVDSITKAQGFSIQLIDLIHISGIPLLQEGVKSSIGVKSEELSINYTHTLPLKRVKRVQYLTEDELIERQKSVIKRALVGGLLGPVGAIVGGISGVGSKQTKETQHFLSIDFTDKDSNDLTAVFLIGKHGLANIQEFVNDVNIKVGYKESEKPTPSIINKYEI